MSKADQIRVLWRLRGHGRDVRCLRQAGTAGFELRVLWGQQLFLTEAFQDEQALMTRASAFRQSLLSRGWQPLPDVGPGEWDQAGPADDMVIGLEPGEDEAAYLAEMARLASPDLGRRQTVLVVDDETEARGVLRSHLEQSGYAVCEAGDVDSALDVLEAGPVDALVLDARMPDPAGLARSGLEVLTFVRLHAAFAGLPVIVLAGEALEPEEQALLTRHRADLFMKPDGYRSLLRRLDQLTGRREH